MSPLDVSTKFQIQPSILLTLGSLIRNTIVLISRAEDLNCIKLPPYNEYDLGTLLVVRISHGAQKKWDSTSNRERPSDTFSQVLELQQSYMLFSITRNRSWESTLV